MPLRRAATPTFLGIVSVLLLQAAGCGESEGTGGPDDPSGAPTGGRFEASGGVGTGGVGSGGRSAGSGGRSAGSGGRPMQSGGATSTDGGSSQAGAPPDPGGEGGVVGTGGGHAGSTADDCRNTFTQPIMAFDDIELVTPIGLVGGGGTGNRGPLVHFSAHRRRRAAHALCTDRHEVDRRRALHPARRPRKLRAGLGARVRAGLLVARHDRALSREGRGPGTQGRDR